MAREVHEDWIEAHRYLDIQALREQRKAARTRETASRTPSTSATDIRKPRGQWGFFRAGRAEYDGTLVTVFGKHCLPRPPLRRHNPLKCDARCALRGGINSDCVDSHLIRLISILGQL